MKKGWILGLGALLALGSFAALPHGEASIAYATEGDITPVEDADLQKYFIAGTGFMVGEVTASWADTPLYPTSAFHKEIENGVQQLWYQVEVVFNENAEFKVVKNVEKDGKPAQDWYTPAVLGNKELFSGNDGQNVKVLKTGKYTLKWADGVEGWGTGASNGWVVEYAPIETKYDVTYWDGDTVVAMYEDAAFEGTFYQPTFQFYEGHTLDGYYSDPECENPITGAIPVAGDIDIYGLWGPAATVIDLTIYFQGTYEYAYAWRDVDGGFEVAYPGYVMTTDIPGSFASDVKAVVLPGEYEFDRIIFGNNSDDAKTANLEISIDNYLYTSDTTAEYKYWGSDAGWMDETASADRHTALEVVELWRTYIRREGRICWLEDDPTMWETVKAQVEDVSAGAYNLIYNAEDIEGVTIGQSYEYLVQLIDGTVPGGEAFGLYPAGTSQEDIALYLALGSLGLLVLGAGAYLLYRRKRNRA